MKKLFPTETQVFQFTCKKFDNSSVMLKRQIICLRSYQRRYFIYIWESDGGSDWGVKFVLKEHSIAA